VLHCTANAQKKKEVVEGDENINATTPDSLKYKYPSFMVGRVTFKDGTVGGSAMNYNLLLGEVQFVSAKGDTLSLANELTIKHISIGSDTFYYDKIYLQFVAGNATAKLAKSEKLRLADVKKMGGYGMYSSTGGIDNYSSINTPSGPVRLEEKMRMVLIEHTFYYIGDRFEHFLPASKKNVYKMFGKKQGLDSFLDENKIDFAKESDLEKLVAYLNE